MARRFMQSMVFVSWLAGGDWDSDVRLEGWVRPFRLRRILGGVVGWPCRYLRCME
jgi:hypothetical protein